MLITRVGLGTQSPDRPMAVEIRRPENVRMKKKLRALGAELEAVRQAQLEGRVSTREEALGLLRDRNKDRTG